MEWKGLEIHPEVPAAGLPSSVFRGPYFEMVAESLRRLAAESRLVIRSPEVLANTHLALQAAEFARDAGCLEPFHRRLFAAYFQEGQNIGERDVLLKTARRAGLDVGQLGEALATGRYEERVAEAWREARELGIDGVPTFLMEGMRLVGAQPYELLRQIAERAGAQRKPR